MSDRVERVLLLGVDEKVVSSSEQFQACSYPWSKVDRVPAIRDFDWIFLNLLSLPKDGSIDWDAFFERFTIVNARDVIAHRGHFVMVGDPRFEVSLPDGKRVKFLDWTGLEWEWNDLPGESVQCLSGNCLAEYLSSLKRWTYSLKSASSSMDLYKAFGWETGKELNLKVEETKYAINRNKESLAQTLNIDLIATINGEQKVSRMGGFSTFPQTTLPAEKLFPLVLRGFLRLEMLAEPPAWIEEIDFPEQKIIDHEISSAHRAMEQLSQELASLNERRVTLQAPRGILYEEGIPLEYSIRNVLETLGATFSEEQVEGRHDGFFAYKVEAEIRAFVAEVKSTRKKTIGMDGLRQAMDWRSRLLAEQGISAKAILIVNSDLRCSPKDRECPFNEDIIARAKMGDVCILTTWDLYSAFMYATEKGGSVDELFALLFSTRGRFDVKDLKMNLGGAVING